MNKKNLISLTIFLTFLAMSVTGILMWAKLKPHFVEITHTLVGLLFVGFAIFHLLNNWSSITAYTKERKSGKIQKEFIYASVIFGVILIGGLTEILEPVAEAGRVFAGGGPGGKRPERVMFEEISTNEVVNGSNISLIIQKEPMNPKMREEMAEGEIPKPTMAIWIEDATGKKIDNLMEADKPAPWESFILNSKTTAKAPFNVKVELKTGDKTELYTGEIKENSVVNLTSKDGKSLIRSIVEF